jgi:hypothetical protein
VLKVGSLSLLPFHPSSRPLKMWENVENKWERDWKFSIFRQAKIITTANNVFEYMALLAVVMIFA